MRACEVWATPLVPTRWVFRMRAYAGGRFAGLCRMAYLGTP